MVLKPVHTFSGQTPLDGVMVAYPISRTDSTPLDRLCVADLLSHCLGTQACEYVLDVNARTKTDKGIFTCSYGGTFGKILPKAPSVFRDRAVAAAMKEDRFYWRKLNKEVLVFVEHIQDRINVFVDYMDWLMTYLDEQEKKHPDLAEFTGRMKRMAHKKMAMFGGRAGDPFKRADGVKRAIPMLATVYAVLTRDTPEQVSQMSAPIPSKIGDPQDLRVAQLRIRIKQLRAMATLEMAINPQEEEMAKEIRKRSEEVLRNPTGYENPLTW